MVTAAEPTMRRVEFVGLPNPFFDPAVLAMKARGEITPKRRAALTKMEQRRQMQGFVRMEGRGVRIVKYITPEQASEALARKGITGRTLSRRYEWNPENRFTEAMTLEDIDTLMLLHDAHAQAFRVLDEILVL